MRYIVSFIRGVRVPAYAEVDMRDADAPGADYAAAAWGH